MFTFPLVTMIDYAARYPFSHVTTRLSDPSLPRDHESGIGRQCRGM